MWVTMSMTRNERNMSIMDMIILFIKRAGAQSENTFDHNGLFSYHAESHAAGMGIAGGFIFTATGEATLLGMVYGAAIYGRTTEVNDKRRKILVDIRDEWHYALGGIVFGAVLGMVANLAVNAVAPSVSSVI